jgi:hypothetical protein
MITHIARQGRIIGKFLPDYLGQVVQDGTIRSTDHWWREGMKDWILVSSQSPLAPDREPTPASMPQGGDKRMEDSSKPFSSVYGASTCCTPSGKLRREIFYSLKLIDSFTAKLRGENKAASAEGELNVEHLRDEIESAQFGIEALYQHRAEYWVGLIELSKSHDKEALMSMHLIHQDLLPAIHHGQVGPDQVMGPVTCLVPGELNDHLFFLATRLPSIPSLGRVIKVLKELDEKSLTWDDDQPALLLNVLLGNKV